MSTVQLERMRMSKGFIAALDQSGGSTPKALERYGISKDSYGSEEEMYQLIHKMRTRIMESPAFTKDKILGAILFEKTMDSKVKGQFSADYLWERKGILSFLKVDKGLADLENGVQLMKAIPNLDELLGRAKDRHIFGTKMRSVIKEVNEVGIQTIVDQQFKIGKIISKAGLIPILEPEVDIHMKNKKQAESILKQELLKNIKALDSDTKIMLKLTLPEKDNLYEDLMEFPNLVRIVALSGGYSRQHANEKLAKNHNLIASFSRALTEGLNVNQSEDEFNEMLNESIKTIYEASIK